MRNDNEVRVIAAVLNDYAKIYTLTEIEPRTFIDQTNSKIWQGLLNLNSSETKDSHSIPFLPSWSDEQRMRLLEIMGEPTTVTYEHNAKAMLEDYRKRKIKCELENIIKKADIMDTATISLEINKTLQDLERGIESRSRDFADIVQDYKKDLLSDNESLLGGFSTGFKSLDTYMPMKGSELNIIGARPGTGKTALMLQIIKNACEIGKRCLMFNLEMPAKLLIERMLVSHFQKPRHEIKIDAVALQEMDSLSLNLEIIDNSRMSVADIRLASLASNAKEPLDLIAVDYFQLIGYDKRQAKHDALGEVCTELKRLANELNIPVLLLCQINRNGEGEIPKLSHLKDSGQIEQDANLVLLIHAERKDLAQYGVDLSSNMRPLPVPCKFLISKSRSGKTGFVEMGFRGDMMSFYETQQGQSF